MAAQGSKDIPPLTAEETQKLVEACIEAKVQAYAPYSKYRVGAGLLTEDGSLYKGCSVDNAVYPLTTCAERCVIVKAVSEGKKVFRAISVASDMKDRFIPPCGSCRQIMAEFGVNYWVVMTKPDGSSSILRVRDLLPHSFTNEDLRAGQSKHVL